MFLLAILATMKCAVMQMNATMSPSDLQIYVLIQRSCVIGYKEYITVLATSSSDFNA